MTPLYPNSLAELDPWRKQAGTTLDEARKRFAQFVVLECVAAATALRTALAFKGGNALRFVYGNPRSTLDLDFTADSTFPDDGPLVRARLDAALGHAHRRFGVKMKCQKVSRNPKRKDATFPTFQTTVGYQFPGDRYFPDFETSGRTVTTVVELEISLNDLVCEAREVLLPPHSANLRVCSLEDILAEKLRALLQQPLRNRTRPQDVFDIARVLRHQGDVLDYDKIADYFVRKSRARGIAPCKSAFDEAEVRERASTGYDALADETTEEIIPFPEAWGAVVRLVGRLGIPAE
jgi:predicted nucleotidyltransferase component of viral defense system